MAVSSHKAEATIEFVGKDRVTDLVQKIDKGIEDIGRKGADLPDQTARWRRELAGVSSSWATLATGMNSVLSLGASVVSAVQSVGQAISDTANERALEARFEKMFGSIDDFAGRIQKATGGQLEDDVFQKIAIKLGNAGVSADHITQSLRQAVQAANALGEDVTQVAEAMASDLIKASDRGLKSLGINIDLQSVLEEQARSLGKSVDELTLAERQAGLLEARARALQAAYGDLDIDNTVVAGVNRARVAWDGFVDSVKALPFHLFASTTVVDTRMAALVAQLKAEQAALDRAARAPAPGLAREATEAWEARVKELRALKDLGSEEELRLRRLAELATSMDEVALATRLNADADEVLRNSVAKTTMGIREQYDALIGQADAAWADTLALSALADAQGDAARAIELWNQAELQRQRLTGTTTRAGEANTTPTPARRRGGGGGRRREAAREGAAERELGATIRGFRSLADSIAEADERARLDEVIASSQAARAELEAQIDAWARLDGAARSAAEAAFGGATQALQSSGDQFLQGFATLNDAAWSETQRFLEILDAAEKAGGGIGLAAQKAAPGAISALGKVAASFAQDKRLEFAFLAAGEGAAALASFATGDFLGGGLHTAAAVQYGVAAALAGGSAAGAGAGAGGGGRSKPNIPAGFTPGQTEQTASNVINLHFSGAHLFADDPGVYRKLGNGIARELRYAGPRGYSP